MSTKEINESYDVVAPLSDDVQSRDVPVEQIIGQCIQACANKNGTCPTKFVLVNGNRVMVVSTTFLQRIVLGDINALSPGAMIFEREGGKGSVILRYIGTKENYTRISNGRLYASCQDIDSWRYEMVRVVVADGIGLDSDSDIEPTSKVDHLSEMSEEELIAMLGSSTSPRTRLSIQNAGYSRKVSKKARKLVKMVNPKDKKTNQKTPKWRSVEPTSRFLEPPREIEIIEPDVSDDYPFVPVEPPQLPPQMGVMDLVEDLIMRVETKEKYRKHLFDCIDFDTPMEVPHLLRIKGHLLEFIGNVLRETVNRYGDSMPTHLTRSMALRSAFLLAGAAAKQELKRKQVRFRAVHRFKKYHNKFLFRYSFDYLFDQRVIPMVEPTSKIANALQGIAASVYAGYSFYKAGAQEDEDVTARFIMNWAMQGVTVITKGVFIDWLLWILSFINIFKSIPSIASDLFTLIQKLLNKLPSLGFGPQQATVGQNVEPTSYVEVTSMFSDAFSGVACNVGTVATVLSVFVVCVSSIMLGLNIKEVCNAESLATKFVKAGVAISKGKTGLYAIVAMIGDLKPWIEQALASLSLNGLQDTFSRNILQCDIEDTEFLFKKDIFKYVEYLINPLNYLKISQSKDEQLKLAWTHSVLSKVLENNAKNPTLSVPATQLIMKHLSELNKVRSNIFRHVRDEETRFVPFWINIYGLAGTRKSTFMSKLAKNLIAALRKLGKYGISGDNNIYSVNFTDKYLTGYNQEDLVMIDDIFQDATPLGDRSSALDIISWVSNIPHLTNQAALEDKGLPFTSKIIISTTNVSPAALQRKEITSQEALKRRMKFAVEFAADETAPVDPMLGAKIRIYRLNPLAASREAQPIKDSQTLCAMVLKEYIDWYNLQQDLISNGGVSKDCVSQMLQFVGYDGKEPQHDFEEMEEEVTPFEPVSKGSNLLEQPEEPKDDFEPVASGSNLADMVEPTSLVSWWNGLFGSIGTNPHLTRVDGIETFDVNYHPELSEINEIYRRYHAQAIERGLCPRGILSFYESYMKIVEDTRSMQDQLNGAVNWLQKTLDFLKTRPIWLYLGTALGALAAYKWYTQDKRILEPTAVQYDYGKPIRRPPKMARAVVPTSATMDAYKEDFVTTGTDTNAMDLVLTSLIGKGGISRLIIPLQDGRTETAVTVRIGGTSILSNHHVFAKLQDGDEFVIEIPHYLNAMKPVKQIFNPKRLYRIGKADACVYKCDNSMPQARNLVHHFSSDDVKIKSTNAIIATRNPEAMYVSNVIANPVTKPEAYTDEFKTAEYSTLGGYEVTNYITTKGMSGSLLVALDPYNPRKLLGIQTARHARSKAGFFQPITQSMLLEALKALGEDLSATPAEREFVLEACSVVLDQQCPPNLGNKSLIYIGKLDKSSQIQFQKKSKLCESLVHDPSTLTKAPAVLDKYDERLNDEVYGKDLMFRNMEGYDKADYGAVNTRVLDEVTELLSVEYSCVRSVPGITRRLLTDDEMVNGIPGKINPLDMTTSPGYPFVKQRVLTGVNGKYEWFDETITENGRKLYSPRPILADRLKLRESAAQNGQRIESIAYSCLKDETRPLARVEQGITRVFICLPMDYNLLVRKYFGMYTATQHALAGKIPSSVGIDPVTGWKSLYDRLRSKGDLWEDFDYKNWDQFLHPEFVKRYASIVNAWYGDADDSPAGKVRHTLMQELVYTYLIVGNRLFMKTGGQCSGCAITAEINCDIHDIIMFYVFCLLALENDITLADNGIDSLLTYYRENCELALYGDDIVKSATRLVTKWFNGKTIAPKMEQLGMKITPADKESVDFVIKKPEEVTFLKRGFKPDPQYPERFVRAPLDHKTIWNIPQWIKNCDDKQGATRVNCEMALREMYMYGETNFNNARNYLNKRIELYNLQNPGAEIRPLTLTYSKLEHDYEEGTLTICYPKGWFDMPEEPALV